MYEGCSKVYSIITHLKRHVRTTHEKAERILSGSIDSSALKTIKCLWTGNRDKEESDSDGSCHKLFTNVTNMLRHIREVHENPKTYKCLECGMTFRHKLKLKRHEIQQHTYAHPFSCSTCKRGFYQQWQLGKHSCGAAKTYRCTKCEMKFGKWSLYIKHCRELQHGRKYHQCEYCNKKYSRPSELQYHIKLKHSIMIEADNNNTNSNGTISFPCPYENCTKTYSYEKNLKQHIRSTHECKRYCCLHEDCEREFTSIQNLHKHFQRDHPLYENTSENRSERYTHKKNDAVDKESPKPKPKEKKRKQRKDAGISKVSTLVALSGLIVNKELNEQIRCRESEALEHVTDSLKFCLQMDIN